MSDKTPTPVDPLDGHTLNDAYQEAVTQAVVAWIYSVAHENGVLAVARAVLPEGYAVYDTRTHVAVPIAKGDA